MGSGRVLAVGNTTVLVATRFGVFALDSRLGIAGPLALPGDPDPASVRNVGFGTLDEVVYGAPDGR